VWLAGHEVRTSVCVGTAVAPDHGHESARLIRSAELALWKAKQDGPGHARLFLPDYDDELAARLKLERSIVDALENRRFLLHFQPLVDARADRLTGFEALLRLPDGKNGFVPPDVFIPVAEKMGLIDQIGAWVIGEACTTAAAWPEELTVAVNLSPAQFARGNVAAHVAAALAASGLTPQRLELEITESLLIEDTEAVMDQLARLKDLGAAIVMDDFGTGYSSLGYLWRFPFDKIKIDRSFLHAYDGDDATAEKIIRTIVALGHALRVRVNAEGVETERHAAFVRTIDCDEVQGFFYGRPMPASDVAATILARFRRQLQASPAAEPAASEALRA
jgi:predicted signal transduction protein with EAL and GGDEF domain